MNELATPNLMMRTMDAISDRINRERYNVDQSYADQSNADA
jgi:hypothetical protein